MTASVAQRSGGRVPFRERYRDAIVYIVESRAQAMSYLIAVLPFMLLIITYNDPFFVGSRHKVQGQDMPLGAIATALANFARAGAGTLDH